MSYFAPLLADADMLKLILLVVVGLIYLVNYLVGGNGAKGGPQRRGLKPEPRPAARPRPRTPAPRPQAQSTMSDEVNAFLRRAAEKRGQAARPATPPPLEAEPRRLVASLDDTSFSGSRPAESGPPTGSGVAEYVEQQLGHRPFDEGHLGHVGQAASQFAAHTQQVFQHSVGHLAAQSAAAADADAAPSPTTPPANPVAETVGALLADPRSIRQAVILNEILDRPVERW